MIHLRKATNVSLLIAAATLFSSRVGATDVVADARAAMVEQAWRLREPGYDQGKLGTFSGEALRGASSSAELALSDCNEHNSLSYRQYCGRLHKAAADLTKISLRSLEVGETERFQHLRSVAGHIIDAVSGHDGGLTTYQENYAVLRPDPLEMKFQISFKYKLFVDSESSPKQYRGVWGFVRDGLASHTYFSYTQKSFWDLKSPSAPFRDINFNPQLYLYYPRVSSNHWLAGYRFGVGHESNGRDGSESRSWNRAFAETDLSFGSLVLSPKVWYVINKDGNPDIEKYAGHAEIRVRYEFSDGSRLHLAARRGTEKGSLEAAYMFKMPFLTDANSTITRFDPWVYLQYWTGYGEDLLLYREKSSSVRLGFAFSLQPVYPTR